MELLLLVIVCTVVVLFLTEWMGMVKKTFAIPGVLLVVPLVAATAVIISFEFWVFTNLRHVQNFLQALVTAVGARLAFFKYSQLVAEIIILTAIAMLPVYINSWLHRKEPPRGFRYYFRISAIAWIIGAMLLFAN